jgi:dephospho-CoA kinase
MMKVYGVTGGAGTGKSEVMRLLKERFNGYVILTDDLARELTLKDNISYRLIVAHFGKEILGEDGEIDRKKLAERVFNQPEELEALNGMTHPYVKEEIKRQIEEAKASGKYAFVALESAILIESGCEKMCDELWYVHTDPEIRRQRMKETRNYSDEKVDAVMKNQSDDAVLFKKCHFVIENNTTLEAVYEQLKKKLGE